MTRILGFILSAFIFAAYGAPSYAASAPFKLIVGYAALNPRVSPLWIAEEQGLFSKFGIDVQPIYLRGAPTLVAGLASGDMHIGRTGGSATLAAIAAGHDFKMVGTFSSHNTYDLIARANIKRAEDLRGKKIGVSSLGSLTDFLVRSIAKKKGLNPDRDITLLTTGGSDNERVMALKAGSVEASALSHPGYGVARKMGFSMLWDSAKELDYPWMEITTRRAAIKSDRELITQYMKAHMEGIALFKTNREFSVKVIKKVMKLTDDELVNESYDIFSKMFLPTPYPNHPGMKISYEYVAMTRNDVWSHKPEEFTDPSFVTELDKSGFIKSLYVR